MGSSAGNFSRKRKERQAPERNNEEDDEVDSEAESMVSKYDQLRMSNMKRNERFLANLDKQGAGADERPGASTCEDDKESTDSDSDEDMGNSTALAPRRAPRATATGNAKIAKTVRSRPSRSSASAQEAPRTRSHR